MGRGSKFTGATIRLAAKLGPEWQTLHKNDELLSDGDELEDFVVRINIILK
jgi:hypothetical protein